MKNRPNVVFVLADDMGYGDSSCYGATQISTPSLDSLAREGLRFTDAHASSAVCTPSRYSILTGRYCWRSSLKKGVIRGHDKPLIEQNRCTIANVFKRQGYHTGAFGKWHVGLNWTVKNPELDKEDPARYDYTQPVTGGPCSLGFDEFFGTAGSLDMAPYCFIENDRITHKTVLKKDYLLPNQVRGIMDEDWDDTQADVRVIEKAKDFIDRHAHEEAPFFMYVPILAPHRPCAPADFIAGRSKAGKRGDMVCEVDWCVEQLIAKLKNEGIYDDTLFIFASDNGGRALDVDGRKYGHRANGELRGEKADIWDGGHRIPLIMRWPAMIKPAQTTGALVCLMDLMPTMAELVGDTLKPGEAPDGVSFFSTLSDPTKNSRQWLVHHSALGMFSLRTPKYKYIRGLGSGGFSYPVTCEPQKPGEIGQLYDIEEDIWETSNRYLFEPQIVAQLDKLLSDVIALDN